MRWRFSSWAYTGPPLETEAALQFYATVARASRPPPGRRGQTLEALSPFTVGPREAGGSAATDAMSDDACSALSVRRTTMIWSDSPSADSRASTCAGSASREIAEWPPGTAVRSSSMSSPGSCESAPDRHSIVPEVLDDRDLAGPRRISAHAIAHRPEHACRSGLPLEADQGEVQTHGAHSNSARAALPERTARPAH